MKLVRRLALVILAVALLSTCLAVFAGAVGTHGNEFGADNIEDVLEYHFNEVFIHDSMNSYDDLYNNADDNVFLALDYTNSATVKDPLDSGNNVLQIIPQTKRNANFIVSFGEARGSAVIATKVMFAAPVDDGDSATAEKAPTFNMFIKMTNDTGLSFSETFFAIDYKSNEILYRSYDEASGRLSTENKLEITPEENVWYDLEFIFDFEKGTYSISVKAGDNAPVTAVADLGEYASALETRMLVKDSMLATMWCDYLDVYEGTFRRALDDKSGETVKYIADLGNLAGYVANTADANKQGTLESRVKIADVYSILYNLQGNPYGANLDAVSAEDFINDTYIEALVTYSAAIDTSLDYYTRLDYTKHVSKFDNLLPADQTEFEALAGYTAGDFEAAVTARNALDEEISTLAAIKSDSDAFIEKVSKFDTESKDYAYMVSQYAALSVYEKRDRTYIGVSDAELVFTGLGVKIKAIETVSNNFIDNVFAMSAIYDPATADSIVCGAGFEVYYYTNFKTADSLISDEDVLYAGLDNSTYQNKNGDKLVDVIAVYKIHEAYIQSRIAISKDFIAIVEHAGLATTYLGVKDQITEALKYIDNDITDGFTVEEKYEGVLAAKDKLEKIQQRLEDEYGAAEDYIAAVNKINENMSYSEMKSAIVAALALKSAANIIGLPDDLSAQVSTATVTLSNFQTKIETSEGYSKILIDSVAALDNSKLTMAERYDLLVSAKNASERSDDAITGVAAAKTKLEAKIKAYNNDVKSVNTALANATTNANAICSAGVAVKAVRDSYSVVAVVFKEQ